MATFKSKDDFVGVLTKLWTRVFDTPEIVNSLSGVKLVVKFRFPDYGNALYVDTTGEKPRLFWDGADDTRFDVELIQSSDISHRFWMQDLNVPLAIASRKVVAKGSVQEALKLIPAMKPAFALYGPVLRECGYGHLLETGKAAKRRRWRLPLFRVQRKAEIILDALPRFPLEVGKPDEAIRPSHSGDKPASTDTQLLETMYRIRYFEEHLADAFRKGDLPTEAIHLSIGQEAVAAGVCLNLRDTDYLNTTHRGHGHIIAKGAELPRMMAEIYGKAGGLCSGKGGSMHVTDARRGILGANGIVGAGFLLALGAAFTIKHERRDDISVVIAGDGAVNQGMFHEAANMISVFNLPVLIVIENNRYGEFTPLERHSAVPELHRRAAAYNIPAERIDGNDARAVSAKVAEVLAAMRRDGRPRLLELMTYRYHGHMEGDGEGYRTEEEKTRFKQEDPIERLEKAMRAAGVTEDQFAAIREAARRSVQEAVAFAEKAPLPDKQAIETHVYSAEPEAHVTGEIGRPDSQGPCREVSVAQAINEAIAEEMERDDRVFLWGEDVALGGYFNVTEGLSKRFGDQRIIDTPISEYAIIGGAVGAAITGMRPIAEILFADFLSCCMDPILNQAAKLRYMTGGQVSIPFTLRTPVGAGIGMAAQHSQSMEKFFVGIPGLIVVAPSDAYTAKGLLKTAIRSDNPVLFIEHKLLYSNAGKIPDKEYLLPFGKARVVRSGSDVTLVSHLLGVGVAIDAADALKASGIEAEVIDLVTLYPMDTQTLLDSLRKTGRLITIEEGPMTLGIGAEVIARVATAGFGLLKAPPIRIAAPETPVPYARNLETAMLPDPERVAQAVRRLM